MIIKPKIGEVVIFYTACGDVYVRPIFFNYPYCDIWVDGLDESENVIKDNMIWACNIYLKYRKHINNL